MEKTFSKAKDHGGLPFVTQDPSLCACKGNGPKDALPLPPSLKTLAWSIAAYSFGQLHCVKCSYALPVTWGALAKGFTSFY